ncbi:MAG: hypothetical protein ACREFP_04215 [Acetobacteraceae bacterium]
MAEAKSKPTPIPVKRGESRIIGFRLPVKVAEAVKVEAARRNLPLNALFVEMWELYRERKRAV